LIEGALSCVPEANAYLFEPGNAPAAVDMVNRTRRPKLTVAKAAVLGLMQNYLAGLMDVGVSLLEIHKLMYFLQVAGEPLKLNYKVGPYGPYAENLRHVLGNLESHYIHGYGERGDDPRKPIELADGAGAQGQAILQDYPKTRERFGRVSQLIEGFESPYGMELLATVHWVADRQGAETLEQAVDKVHGWNPRKMMFTPHQIQAAWDRLHRLGWLDFSARANAQSG
jgi:uncharacterized protein YwgA